MKRVHPSSSTASTATRIVYPVSYPWGTIHFFNINGRSSYEHFNIKINGRIYDTAPYSVRVRIPCIVLPATRYLVSTLVLKSNLFPRHSPAGGVCYIIPGVGPYSVGVLGGAFSGSEGRRNSEDVANQFTNHEVRGRS